MSRIIPLKEPVVLCTDVMSLPNSNTRQISVLGELGLRVRSKRVG
jgi:hypothetical protein